MKNLPRMLLLSWGTVGLLVLSGCWQRPADRLVGRWQGRPEHAADQTSTMLEAFDFSISLDFVDSRHVHLAFGEGENDQPRSGTWQVIEAAGDRLTIEIITDATAGAAAHEIRRFKIHFPPGNDNQFTLVEDGADAQYGAIVFQRIGTK